MLNSNMGLIEYKTLANSIADMVASHVRAHQNVRIVYSATSARIILQDGANRQYITVNLDDHAMAMNIFRALVTVKG